MVQDYRSVYIISLLHVRNPLLKILLSNFTYLSTVVDPFALKGCIFFLHLTNIVIYVYM